MELLLFDCSHSQTPTEVHEYGEISATATDGNDENDDDTKAVASTFQSSLCEVEESDTSRNEEETDSKPGKKRASQAIARDKAVTRKVSKISNKEAAMQSSESLASAIRDASVTQGERRKQEMMLWLQHEAKEREEDRELEKLRIEMQEKESKRRFECEMMRFRGHQFTGPSQSNFNYHPHFGYSQPKTTGNSTSRSLESRDFTQYNPRPVQEMHHLPLSEKEDASYFQL